jgi:hypothetical protein
MLNPSNLVATFRVSPFGYSSYNVERFADFIS